MQQFKKNTKNKETSLKKGLKRRNESKAGSAEELTTMAAQ